MSILFSGFASATKSSTPASRAMVAAVRRLSPVTMTVRMPIRRSSSNRSTMPGLDGVLQVDQPEDLAVLGDGQRRAALAGDPLGLLLQVGRRRAAATRCTIESTAPFMSAVPFIRRPLIRVSAVNGTTSAPAGDGDRLDPAADALRRLRHPRRRLRTWPFSLQVGRGGLDASRRASVTMLRPSGVSSPRLAR